MHSHTHRQTCSENDTSQAVVAGNQYQSAYTVASNEMIPDLGGSAELL